MRKVRPNEVVSGRAVILIKSLGTREPAASSNFPFKNQTQTYRKVANTEQRTFLS
jgi:hypothetical protein